MSFVHSKKKKKVHLPPLFLTLHSMQKLKKLYQENIYGVIGTLVFHILLFSSFLLAKVDMKGEVKEEPILIDFTSIEELMPEIVEEKPEDNQEDENTPANDNQLQSSNSRSNRAVNDAPVEDPFFDSDYMQEIAAAQQLVSDVSSQLSKEIPEIKEFEMPEVTTEGIDLSEIKNTIYSGESNIHYFLENRYHTRLPIPVYLARGGGIITVNIWVSISGKVIKAVVQKNDQINDPLLPVYAEQAALRTVFNADQSAPSPQQGTITYTFVPQ